MLTKLYILFLTFFIGNGLLYDCSNNDSQNLLSCYNTYFHLLKTNSSKYFDTESNYFNSTDTIDKLCSYYNTLKTCLGNDIVKNCINYKNVVKIFGDYGDDDIASDYFELEFLCGNGKNAYKSELNCIIGLNISCNNNIDNCSEAKNYINCWTNGAKNLCGQNGYYYLFNQLSIYFCQSKYQCKNICIDGTDSNSAICANISSLTFFISVIFFFCLFLK